MNIKIFLIFFYLIIHSCFLFGDEIENKPISIDTTQNNFIIKVDISKKKTFQIKLHKHEDPSKDKLTAVALTLFTGVFGMHRLYLGTKNVVPVVYTVTLGGGFGFLTISDLIAIISTKDLSKYENNSQIFMWVKKKEK